MELIRETRAMFESLEFELEVGPVVSRVSSSPPAGPASAAPPRARRRLLGNDILRVADGRFAEYWVASWAPS